VKDEREMPDESRAEASPAEAPQLPTEKVFLVQFRRETGPTLEPFAGRVEHLASGRRVWFTDVAAFRAALTRFLTEAKQR
jgi:hypothetical protein